jgi:F-type H+-transporting ATPase subunit epsilon
MATMLVDVVSAEAQLYSGEAEEVYARSTEGEIGILPGHIPLLIALEHAPVRVKTVEGREVRIDVRNGFLEFRDNHLTVLADSAEVAES